MTKYPFVLEGRFNDHLPDFEAPLLEKVTKRAHKTSSPVAGCLQQERVEKQTAWETGRPGIPISSSLGQVGSGSAGILASSCIGFDHSRVCAWPSL